MPPDLRSEIFGLKLSQQQLETVSKIWHALDDQGEAECMLWEDGSESGRSQESGSRSKFSPSTLRGNSPKEDLSGNLDLFQLHPHVSARVTEWLFALSCQFVAQIACPGEEQTLPLVHFTSVLGIHSYSLVYRTAYSFTSALSGLIWVCRLIMLEYALPLHEYDSICWPARRSYDDQLSRLHYVRRKYLCRGGFHPTAQLIESLAYGRRIARKEGCRTNISWSSDKEVLTLYDQRVTMSAFQGMVWSSIQECQGMLSEAMFGWVPPRLDLHKVRDNMTET